MASACPSSASPIPLGPPGPSRERLKGAVHKRKARHVQQLERRSLVVGELRRIDFFGRQRTPKGGLRTRTPPWVCALAVPNRGLQEGRLDLGRWTVAFSSSVHTVATGGECNCPMHGASQDEALRVLEIPLLEATLNAGFLQVGEQVGAEDEEEFDAIRGGADVGIAEGRERVRRPLLLNAIFNGHFVKRELMVDPAENLEVLFRLFLPIMWIVRRPRQLLEEVDRFEQEGNEICRSVWVADVDESETFYCRATSGVPPK